VPWTSNERPEVKAYYSPLCVLTIQASKYQLVSPFMLITEWLLLGWLTKGDLAKQVPGCSPWKFCSHMLVLHVLRQQQSNSVAVGTSLEAIKYQYEDLLWWLNLLLISQQRLKQPQWWF